MSYEYKTVNNRTEKDIQEQEKLQKEGWKVIDSGFYAVIMEREKELNVRKSLIIHRDK